MANLSIDSENMFGRTHETEHMSVWGTGKAVSVAGSNWTWAGTAIIQRRGNTAASEQCSGMAGIARMIWEELGVRKRVLF